MQLLTTFSPRSDGNDVQENGEKGISFPPHPPMGKDMSPLTRYHDYFFLNGYAGSRSTL